MSKVSIIIPCYNQGAYLEEAVDSVLAQTYQDFEIIIVDDGSTDADTVRMLENYQRSKTRVIHTRNQGLSAARNNGIREASGEYILPLDADDKIGPGYLREAVRILDAYPDIGIVYCEAAFFGVRSDHWHLPEFSSDHLLFQNIIFCSAFFRKRDWEKVGGYNVNMIYGWEDWDFWLSLVHLGAKVYRIPKIFFYYRLREASMSHSMDEKKQFFMRLHAILNHRNLYKWIAEIKIRTRISELFLDTGIGYTPHQVLRHVIFGEEDLLEFDLSGCGNVQQVRFHPINAPVVILLKSVEVTDANGHTRSVVCHLSNAYWMKGQHWLFQEKHPWMLFELDGIMSPQKISIRLNYLAIDHEIYPEIVKIKEMEIEQKQKTIEEILNSTSWKLTRPLRWLKEKWQA